MVSTGKPPSRLLSVVLLACLLVSGRVALAAHVYEHDLEAAQSECAVCEFGHVFKDDLVPSAESRDAAMAYEIRRFVADIASVRPFRGRRLARGPPSPVV